MMEIKREPVKKEVEWLSAKRNCHYCTVFFFHHFEISEPVFAPS
jgi:hypothetical protein